MRREKRETLMFPIGTYIRTAATAVHMSMLDEHYCFSDSTATGVAILVILVVFTGANSSWCTYASGAWYSTSESRSGLDSEHSLGCHPRDCWSTCQRNGYTFAAIEAGTSTSPHTSDSLADDDFIDEARCLCMLGNHHAFSAY
jgi:hypothetical protein